MIRKFHLSDPYAEYLWEGKSTVVVLGTNSMPTREPMVLRDSKFEYGIVALLEPYPISLSDFESMRAKHMVSKDDQDVIWNGVNEMYVYHVWLTSKFEEPREFNPLLNKVDVDESVDTIILSENFISTNETQLHIKKARPEDGGDDPILSKVGLSNKECVYLSDGGKTSLSDLKPLYHLALIPAENPADCEINQDNINEEEEPKQK